MSDQDAVLDLPPFGKGGRKLYFAYGAINLCWKGRPEKAPPALKGRKSLKNTTTQYARAGKGTGVTTGKNHSTPGVYRAAFAFSVRVVNAAGSATAISASILRFKSMPAFFRPFTNVE